MDNTAWMDEHYPRCTRCSLRTYVSNFTGRRHDEITSSSACPGYLLPEADRPTYPWTGSAHAVRNQVKGV